MKNTKELVSFIKTANKILNEENKKKLFQILEDQEFEVRICSKCNNLMLEGYCIEGGYQYFCSDECLKSEMTMKEFNNLYNDGEGDSYWTSWR